MMVTETKEQPVSPLSPNEVLTDERALDDRPTLSQRSEAPRVEYKTLVQQLCGEGNVPKADADLNALLNAAPEAGWMQWEVFQIGDGHPVVVWRATPDKTGIEIWRTVVLFRMSDAPEGDAPKENQQTAETSINLTSPLGEPAPTQFFRVDPTHPITFVVAPVGADEAQAVPAPTPVPVVLPAEAGSTASTLRERLTASDFAFLTAPDKTLIEQ